MSGIAGWLHVSIGLLGCKRGAIRCRCQPQTSPEPLGHVRSPITSIGHSDKVGVLIDPYSHVFRKVQEVNGRICSDLCTDEIRHIEAGSHHLECFIHIHAYVIKKVRVAPHQESFRRPDQLKKMMDIQRDLLLTRSAKGDTKP